MMDLSKFGERVKVERDRLKLTQDALSGKIGGDRSRIAVWEKGKLKEFPSLEVINALAETFHCDIEYLLGIIDGRTRTVTDVRKALGLPDDVVWNLLPSTDVRYDATKSKFISNAYFKKLIISISDYIDYSKRRQHDFDGEVGKVKACKEACEEKGCDADFVVSPEELWRMRRFHVDDNFRKLVDDLTKSEVAGTNGEHHKTDK